MKGLRLGFTLALLAVVSAALMFSDQIAAALALHVLNAQGPLEALLVLWFAPYAVQIAAVFLGVVLGLAIVVSVKRGAGLRVAAILVLCVASFGSIYAAEKAGKVRRAWWGATTPGWCSGVCADIAAQIPIAYAEAAKSDKRPPVFDDGSDVDLRRAAMKDIEARLWTSLRRGDWSAAQTLACDLSCAAGEFHGQCR